MRWAIIYDGGVVVTSDSTTWINAEGRGVLVIVIEDDMVGRQLIWGHDYYWFFPGQATPAGGDIIGLRDYLMEVNPTTAAVDFTKGNPIPQLLKDGVKLGRTVDDIVMRNALQQAIELPGFTPKSAWLATERQQAGLL